MPTLLFFMFPAFLYTYDGSLAISDTDIFERSINFVIFATLLWYLVAGRVRDMLYARQKQISDTLSEAQERIRQLHARREDASMRLKEAKIQAQEIVANANKEAILVVSHIDEKYKEQVEYLMKSNEDAMNFESRKVYNEVIREALHELFKDGVSLSNKDYIDLIERKVS